MMTFESVEVDPWPAVYAAVMKAYYDATGDAPGSIKYTAGFLNDQMGDGTADGFYDWLLG